MPGYTKLPTLIVAVGSLALVVGACRQEITPAPVAPVMVDVPAAAPPSTSAPVVVDEPRERDAGGTFGAALGSFGSTGLDAGDAFASGRRSTVPSIRQGATQVVGRLPPEVVQRVVRQNFGRFRLCYEKGLVTNPKLEGKVVTRFVIDRSGAVTSATDDASDLPDKTVVSCVVSSFAKMAFPQPEAGDVTVTYPIIFAPGARP